MRATKGAQLRLKTYVMRHRAKDTKWKRTPENPSSQLVIIFIIFDWNVLTYLREPDKLSGSPLHFWVLALQEILFSWIDSKRTCFPFSTAHFADIYHGSSDLYDAKLQHLSQITDDWCLFEYPNPESELFLDRCVDIQAYFKICAEHMHSGSTESSEFLKNVQDNVAATLDGQAEEIPSEEWRTLILRLTTALRSQNMDNDTEILRINKAMRNAGPVGEDVQLDFPALSSSATSLDPVAFRASVDEAILNSSFPYRNSTEAIEGLLPYDLSTLPPFMRSLLEANVIVDLVGLSNEKLRKETAARSLHTDLQHLRYGLRTKFFITADEALLQRAKAISVWLDLPVIVFSIQEFVTLTVQVAKKQRPDGA
ncbi:MAG: hypothetical protein KDK37_18865 [Leptospiraceae bacterium]|nr:hypothetical protein [Leptospiraceae bacterium]